MSIRRRKRRARRGSEKPIKSDLARGIIEYTNSLFGDTDEEYSDLGSVTANILKGLPQEFVGLYFTNVVLMAPKLYSHHQRIIEGLGVDLGKITVHVDPYCEEDRIYYIDDVGHVTTVYIENADA